MAQTKTETGNQIETGPLPTFGYRKLAQDGLARRGRMTTAHGTIETPVFMPVGTAATVKGIYPEQLEAAGAEIILGNTYHLMLRPGAELIAELGGLHRFMNWDKPILTDSGGFQVMSLSGLRKIDEEGVAFRSHVDGSRHLLTPERSVRIQELLDADITMQFDECTPYPVNHATAKASMELSLRWAERCRKAFTERPGYALFGIVQGSVFPDLRKASAQALGALDLPGYAVGGLAVGEGQETMFRVLDDTLPYMPEDKPRYLMGVGTPSDMVGAVARGIDMFDCVLPTRSGRTGQAFTRQGKLNMKNARHRRDPRPLDEGCHCPTCQQYSRAYLHHLFRAGEMLGPMLLTQHNLYHYQALMRDIRAAIEAGSFAAFAEETLAREAEGDIEPLYA